MFVPSDALSELATLLRGERSVVSAQLVETVDAEPVLGLLAASGPRAHGREADYALVVESVREGYLLHFGSPRLLSAADRDLALLAGDYLYALGLERLASLGDLEAVRELSDLISLAAQVHDGARVNGAAEEAAAALWLAAATAVGAGRSDGYDRAIASLRGGEGAAVGALMAAGLAAAAAGGFEEDLRRAAERIDFAPEFPS